MAFPDPEFERFFAANYESIVRSMTVITGDHETARDCVQDAFVKASARWRKVCRLDNPAAWVRRVAISRSRDLHRREQRRQHRERRVSDLAAVQADDDAGLIDDSMELLERLRLLPERQRAAVALFYVEDRPVAEIAATLGISTGAVKFHLSAARKTLRGVMKEEGQRYG